MQTLSQRIEIQFPKLSPITTLIGVMNPGVATPRPGPGDRREVMTHRRGFLFGAERLESRGIPDSALHD